MKKLIEHIAIAAICAFLVFIFSALSRRPLNEAITAMLIVLAAVLVILEVKDDDVS